MATALPTFPEFDVSETSTQATRWKKWLSRFQNLVVALNVTDKKRQRALLLHFAGEATNEIFDTLPNTTAGEGDDPFAKAVEALTNYFTPKQNREHEICVFRQAKQENDENLAAFHTRLRQLAVTCEFDDVDREIKTQIVQSCSSHKLRTKALENPSYTLTQLLDAGKAMEHKPLTLRITSPSITCPHVVETDAETIGNQTKKADANPTRNHVTVSHATMVTKTGNQVLNVEIVVETIPVMEEKHSTLPIKPPAEAAQN